MRVGYSGTRIGMTPQQMAAVSDMLRRWRVTHADHGDCTGGDEEFHEICKRQVGGIYVTVHPMIDAGIHAAYCDADEVLPEKPPLDRNLDIIDAATETVIATPKSKIEERRGSGTWHVIRHAPKRGKEVHIVYPDGSVEVRP